MTIIGNKIDAHLLENHEKLVTQAGFTTRSMIEDNVFTLHRPVGLEITWVTHNRLAGHERSAWSR